MYNVSFQGRREVLFALKNAAQSANYYTVEEAASVGPRAINHNNTMIQHQSSMNAYINMATFDNSFYSALKTITNDEIQILKQKMQTVTDNYGKKVNPITMFSDSLKIHAKANAKGKQFNLDVIEEFISKIKKASLH